jgi:uncharacterized protein (DUF1330 family)
MEEKPMKKLYTVAAVVAGVAIGSLGTLVLKAQKPPTGYYVAEVFSISDQAQFDKYAAGVPKTIEKYGGHYLARGGKTKALEGEEPKRIVIIAFNSAADAERWYNSPEYSAIRPIRQGAAKSRGFVVDGVAQ